MFDRFIRFILLSDQGRVYSVSNALILRLSSLDFDLERAHLTKLRGQVRCLHWLELMGRAYLSEFLALVRTHELSSFVARPFSTFL